VVEFPAINNEKEEEENEIDFHVIARRMFLCS